MLTEALFEMKSQIDANSQIDSEKLINDINNETDVEKDLLIMFYNLFVERVLIAEKESITLEERQVKDWMRPEIEIMMLYMDSKKTYEKIGVKESFGNLAELLGKTTLGVQYKYYDERNVLKNPEKKRGKRGRKPKTEPVQETEETKSDSSTEDINKEIGPNVSPIHFESKTPVNQRGGVNRLEETNNIDSNDEKSGPEFTMPDTEELDMIQMLSGMINNFQALSDLTGDKDNKTMKRVVEGIYTLSSIAASNANDAGKTNILKQRINALEEENNQIRNSFQEVKEDYNVLAKKVSQFQDSSDTNKITKLYAFLDDIEKEINEKAYVYSSQSFQIDNKGHVFTRKA